MIRSLWIARTGLDAQQTQLDVIANNLANVSTNGFKRSRAVFEDLLYQNLRLHNFSDSVTLKTLVLQVLKFCFSLLSPFYLLVFKNL